MLFTKKNLIYNDYKWTAYLNNDPRVDGNPDNTLFNSAEGSEVIYMINKLMLLWDYRSPTTGNKIEKLIHDKLPLEIRSQEEVKDWVNANLRF